MYRAHIQHDTQQPVVSTHTAWRESDKSLWGEVAIALGCGHIELHKGKKGANLTYNGTHLATVTIEQRDRSRTSVREQEDA